MASYDDFDSVGDDEIVFRRIPACWYRPDTGFIDPTAFAPSKRDITGLSLGRASFHSPRDEAAIGRAGKEYYIAVLAVSDIARLGATVVARPVEGNTGHAEIPELTYVVRKTQAAVELIAALQKSVLRIEGPFPGRGA